MFWNRPKYQPKLSTDISRKNGETVSFFTRNHCITSMPCYESKSLEELRFEDSVRGTHIWGGRPLLQHSQNNSLGQKFDAKVTFELPSGAQFRFELHSPNTNVFEQSSGFSVTLNFMPPATAQSTFGSFGQSQKPPAFFGQTGGTLAFSNLTATSESLQSPFKQPLTLGNRAGTTISERFYNTRQRSQAESSNATQSSASSSEKPAHGSSATVKSKAVVSTLTKKVGSKEAEGEEELRKS